MYITFDDITDRIPLNALERLCKVTGAELIEKVNAVIARAESTVDGYAAAKYSLPLPVSPLPERWALAIAEHELYGLSPGGSVPEKIRQAFEDTMKELRDLAAGKLSLPTGDDGTEPEQKVGAAIQVASNEQVMDDSIYGY
jgi:phage gp36-like protein